MTLLAEHQFEILPSAEAADGFVFGIGAAASIDDGGFDPGDASWLTQDQTNTRRGVTGFGRDVVGPRTWTWSSHIDQDSTATALDVLDDFSAAWAPDALVRNPGEVTAVRYSLAGRTRRVFGRPRRFAAPPSNRILGGYVPVTHDFATVDGYTYDDVESSAQILYSSSAEGGGFSFPSPMPLATRSSEGTGSDQISVGGRARTYPIIRFNGPWTNPGISTADWTLRWKGQIGPNDWVEIDCRPWRLTVLNASGASVVGGLDRRTWLEDVWFAPQSKPQVSLDGIAASGGASATIRWRNAWTSI